MRAKPRHCLTGSVSSETSPDKVGDDNPNKGIPLTGVEQPFVPLPGNYSFTYSATGDKPPGDDDNELDNPLICVTKRLVSLLFLKIGTLYRWA